MNTETLASEIEKVVRGGNYVSDWAIYADEPFAAESEARQGQTQFDNGGLLDEKSFVATNEQIIDMAHEYCDGDPNAKDCPFGIDEIIEAIIEEINDEIKRRNK